MPPGQPKRQRVAAAVIQLRHTYLVCQRPSHKRHGDLWEFPGGKVERGEPLRRAIARELQEELELRATAVGATLHVVPDPASHFVIHFLAVDVEGEPVLHEHQAVRWCDLGELSDLAMAPSDLQLVHRLRARQLIDQTVRTARTAWGRPNDPSPRVEFSPRLRRSLGRCYPDQGLIRLRADLDAPGHEALLAEVVCHELAHLDLARFDQQPPPKPHGREWRDLVSAAGFPARVRARSQGPNLPSPRPELTYSHRCPVCGAVRWAARPVHSWRCAGCVAGGLSGELLISTNPRPTT